MLFSERKIFSNVWLYSKKCFGKYFLVFGCVAENNIKNTFSSCFSHFLSFQTKHNQKKFINGAIWVKENPFVRVVGLTNGFVGVVGSSARWEWVCRRSGASGFENDGETILRSAATISLLSLLSLSVSLFARGPKMTRRFRWSVTGFDEGGFERSERCDRLTLMRSSCSLSLSLSLSLLFSKAGNHLKWKWKRKSFSLGFGYILRSTGNAFQFDQIWSNNQTPTFPENHFRNQFEVKTNRA